MAPGLVIIAFLDPAEGRETEASRQRGGQSRTPGVKQPQDLRDRPVVPTICPHCLCTPQHRRTDTPEGTPRRVGYTPTTSPAQKTAEELIWAAVAGRTLVPTSPQPRLADNGQMADREGCSAALSTPAYRSNAAPSSQPISQE